MIEEGQEEHADVWIADETERPNEPSETIGLLGPHKAIGECSPFAFVAAGEEFADGLLEFVVLCLQQLDELLAVGLDVRGGQPVEGVGRLKPDFVCRISNGQNQPFEELGHLEEVTEGGQRLGAYGRVRILLEAGLQDRRAPALPEQGQCLHGADAGRRLSV